MSTASKDELERLHNTVAEKLADAIEQMDVETKGLAAVLNVARQFLKDNGIDVASAPADSPMGRLADRMAQAPFDPAEDGYAH